MSNQEAFYSQLYQYIEKIANQVSDLRGSDTIKTGTIIQVLPGHYVVQLNEGNEQSSVKAIALNTNDLFSLQDYVYLMQATGSIENTYFIIGKVEQIQEDFLNLTLTERFTSSNELSGDLLKLNTKIEDLTILSDIKANRVFQIKGTFTCNKLNEENEENEENYGLKVSFNCGDQVIKTYNLDTNYFIGQPFKMTSQPQMRTILLDEVVLKSNFDNIIITKFGSNFTCSDITIASGSLLDVNGIVNVSLSFKNKKDYFSLSGTEVDNSIKVNAEVEYEGAPLVAPGIQYYWLLKDDSIDENSKYYFSYAGKGWKCLNTYDNVSGVGADGFSLTLQIWESGENNIILSETGFPDFINTFKCIVKYQDIVVSSPETTIYNYNKESFFVELESNIQPPLLILETDQVILSAVVEDENEKTHMSDYTCAYQWQVENENGDWEVVTKKEESEGVFEDTFAFNEYNAEHVLTKDWSKLTIVDQLLSDIMEGDSSFYVLHGEGEEITKNFRCVVRVYRKDDLLNYVSKDDLSNYVSEDFSESMQVVSKVAIAAQLVSTTYYKYYISDTPYTLFPKLANKEGDWEGDWSISIKRISEEEEEYFVSQNWTEDSNLAHWSSDGLQEFPGKVNQDAYNYIIRNFIENPQKGSYLYITSQEVWVEKRLKKINFLRKDNWTPPVLAKGYSENGNYLDDKAVDKLNTFTHLTEGGLKKGLLYDEKTGDVYINADFINTGALRVADDEGESIFYADVGTGKVEIAGFTVDENSISHGDKETGDYYVYLGTDGLNVGNVLDVTIDEDGKASASFTGSFEIKDFTDSTGTIASKDEVKNVQENLDSAQKQWEEQLTEEITSTKNIIKGVKADLQNQIDGSISSWFYEGVPTLDNAPASTWKDEEKGAHLGDLYYDLETGKCYRWAQEQNGEALEWKWVLVTDTDIALALENAAKAQATADGKITTFNGNNGTTLPSPPYQKGDLLVNMKRDSSSDAQTYICVINKKAGESPFWNDWTSIGNYATSSTLAAVEDDLQSQIDARMSIWYYNGVPTVSNDPAKNWTTVELQKQHDKDLYYDLDTGRAYRWIYSASGNKWEEVLDIRITQALADAATAQDTADKKRQIFYIASFSVGNLPDDYDVNDMLVVGTLATNAGDATGTPDTQFYICITKKGDNAKSLQHWKKATDMATISTLNQKYQEALEKSQKYADGKINASISAAVEELNQTISDGAYFTVNQDIYEGQHPEGLKVPAIVVATENEKGADFLYLQSSNLIINSDVLKINHNGTTYTPNYFEVNVENAIFKGKIGAENLEVDKLSTIIANMGELTVGAIKSENYSSTPVYENTTYIHSSTEYLWGDEAITNYSFQRTVLPNGNLASTYDLTIYVKVPLPIVNSFCDFSTGNFSSINITYKNQAGKAGIAFNDGTGINTYPSANRPYITLWMRNDGLSSNLNAHLPASITIGNFTYSVSKIKTFSDITGALISFENTDSPYIVFPNFQIAPNGDIYSIGGTIGGFTIGNNALYNGYSIIDPPSFNTIESNTVYLGTDGIRLGEKFSVSPLGRLIAEEGNIAGFEISQTALINNDGTSYITISQGDTNNNYSVSLKGDELVFSHTELDGGITSMHYSRYKENSLLITGEKDANSRRANTILDTMISYSPSLGAGSRITEAATFLTGLKDTYDYRIGYSTAPPIIIGKQQEYNSSGVYGSLIKMGSFLSFPDYKTGVLNYNHAYAYTEKDDDKSTWLLYDYKDKKTYDLPELIKFTAENKEYAESHKFYIWEYPRKITGDMVVASNNKDYPANHSFSKIFGAIATGRRTNDDMNYSKWNAILSTRIDDTIVRVASDSGKCEGGFYCIIFGK